MPSILGHVQNGVVVFDGGTTLPEGAAVRVEVLKQPGHAAPINEQLLEWAGKGVDLPQDLARRHDHYLHQRKE